MIAGSLFLHRGRYGVLVLLLSFINLQKNVVDFNSKHNRTPAGLSDQFKMFPVNQYRHIEAKHQFLVIKISCRSVFNCL